MKRILSAALILCLVCALSACTAFGGKEANNTAAPTEAAETPTEAPAEKPEETCLPVKPKGITDLCIEIGEGSVICDLNLDGMDDTVTISVEPAEYENYYTVTAVLAGNEEEPYSVKVRGYEFGAWVLDCDDTDGRLDIVITYEQDSDDTGSVAIRPALDGSGFEEYCSGCGVIIGEDAGGAFTTENGFSALPARLSTASTRAISSPIWKGFTR